VHNDAPPTRRKPALLCLSQSFSPETTPTAIRASKLVRRLGSRWDVTVLTEALQAKTGHPDPDECVRVQVVPGKRPRRLLAALRRLRLNKLIELLVWPDESIFWVIPAVLAGRRLIRERKPEAIAVFMMPYSAGLAGVLLSRLTGVALVLNLDDSLTCTDMHPYFPTRLHYLLAGALEDFYARHGDAIVYVSQRNLNAVASRQPEGVREKLHLVRYGADPSDFRPHPERVTDVFTKETHVGGPRPESSNGQGRNLDGAHGREGDRPDFELAYVGAMSGWWALIGDRAPASLLKRLYAAWTRLGRHERIVLDPSTSSPAVAGRAILDLIDEYPDWAQRVKLTVYGNPYDPSVVSCALSRAGVEEVVTVLGPMPHAEVAGVVRGADLLFITLPDRLDRSPGGRISAKTYEYLMTDRPILAAVPPGENWGYLEGKPGVWLVKPDDRESMKSVIAELAGAKFAGRALTFDRERLRQELSYETRADEFERVIRAAIERRAGHATSAP
jgi:glycosyltransferase involved in cell wall biosynthesis